MTAVRDVQQRYRNLHGDHPTTVADDRVLAGSHEPVTDDRVLADMAAGVLPMPPFLRSDGTPVAPPEHLDPVGWAGGAERLHDWFTAYWPLERRDVAERAFGEWMAGRLGWLTPATPRTLLRVEQAQAQAVRAVALLRNQPRDPVARGSLEEAVDLLDRCLGPATDVERSRRGGPPAREEWVDALRREHLALTSRPALPIHTERLVLRDHRPDDADALHGYYGRADVSTYLLQEPYTRAEFDDRLREWDGPEGRTFGVVIEHEGRVVGDVVLMFRGATQAELGWVVHPEVGGRGIATEASRALIDVGFGHYGLHRIYAELDARNTASARLCERLGMRREAHRIADFWSKGEWTDTLQYAVLATEWPAPLGG